MPWPKGVPRKGYTKGDLKKTPAGDPLGFPEEAPKTFRKLMSEKLAAIPEAPVPDHDELKRLVRDLAAQVANLAKTKAPATVTPRSESLIERLRRIDDEVKAWTNLAHWASSREDHRPVRAYAKACASSLRLQAIELVQAYMGRLEEYRKKNPVTAAAEKVN